MPDRLQAFVQGIFQTQTVRAKASESDGHLLTAYVTGRDEAAFEALARRHAGMVWGVCRRTLGNDHDAEDAFQATFLILSCKAASIKPPSMVGNWLYGVARRAALKARDQRRRRQLKEKQAAYLPDQELTCYSERMELRQVLDKELSRLPAKYRIPIVLCDLEGLSRSTAAQRLGWPEGTVSGRLSRARELLARLLIRRGLGLMAGAGAANLVSSATTSASVSSGFLETVFEAIFERGANALGRESISASATSLAKGVMRSMIYTAITRAAAVVLLLAALVGGAGLALRPAEAGQQQATLSNAKPDDAKPPATKERTETDCIAELYDAANLELDCKTKEYFAGRGTLAFLFDASRRLVQAELEKSNKKADRIDAAERHLKLMYEIEKTNKLRFEEGKVATQDLASATFHRCEAELNLLREKKK